MEKEVDGEVVYNKLSLSELARKHLHIKAYNGTHDIVRNRHTTQVRLTLILNDFVDNVGRRGQDSYDAVQEIQGPQRVRLVRQF